MVVVFGWGAGPTKDRGEVVEVRCPTCHNDVYLHAIRSSQEFSLYFIPLVPYGSNEYLACPICRHGLRIGAQHAGAVRAMIASTGLWRSGSVSADDYRARVEWFWNELGRPAGYADSPPGGPPATAGGAATPEVTAALPVAAREPSTLADQLRGLADLRDQGLLTDTEFDAAKARLLGT
jgi:uncharacterized protein YbaR (Trm112 family)